MNQTHDTLKWLFERYLENPNGVYDVMPSLTMDQGIEHVHAFGRHLVEKGYVKHADFYASGFACTITTLGINQVSDEFESVRFKILRASIEHKKRSVMEILGIEPEHFRRVHDYATYLKRLGIIECIFHQHDVFAEPTFFGREWYQENKVRFVN